MLSKLNFLKHRRRHHRGEARNTDAPPAPEQTIDQTTIPATTAADPITTTTAGAAPPIANPYARTTEATTAEESHKTHSESNADETDDENTEPKSTATKKPVQFTIGARAGWSEMETSVVLGMRLQGKPWTEIAELLEDKSINQIKERFDEFQLVQQIKGGNATLAIVQNFDEDKESDAESDVESEEDGAGKHKGKKKGPETYEEFQARRNYERAVMMGRVEEKDLLIPKGDPWWTNKTYIDPNLWVCPRCKGVSEGNGPIPLQPAHRRGRF